jgi:hypothetical protein
MSTHTYLEKEKEVHIIHHADVLVIGGGPSGLCAAIGAAQMGASTMIVESMGSFGGMVTNGMVITIAGFNNWLKPYQRVVKGVMGDWLARGEEKGGAENNRSWVLSSDPEIMKLAADELLQENGVKCLLHTWMADVIIEEKQIKGVLVENVDGRSAILAKTVVDCTGNGDVFARAGASFHISSELQPMTLPFFLAEVNPAGDIEYEDELIIPIGPEPGYLGKAILDTYTSRRRDVFIDREKLKKAKENGEIPLFGGPWFGGLRKHFPWVNTTRVYGSAVNAKELTEAEIEARQNAHKLVNYYRKECEGFENSWLMRTASTIGIRETRRLDGVYTLSGEDVMHCRTFDDAIALGTWPIDVHPSKGQSGMHDMFVPLPYQIPYRSLLPRDIDNLIVGGRCISTDREAMGTARVGATCGAIGHAAGVAAALSAASEKTPRQLDPKDIQKELLKQDGIFQI